MRAPTSPEEVGITPIPKRIAGQYDAEMRKILALAPEDPYWGFLYAMHRRDPQVSLKLAGFGRRQVAFALRVRSGGLLSQALLAIGLSTCLSQSQQKDFRDVLMGLAAPWVVAEELGLPPASLFREVADQLPDSAVADLFRGYGNRDITLKASGQEIVTTPDGPDFQERSSR
jgi:hypothetical protein